MLFLQKISTRLKTVYFLFTESVRSKLEWFKYRKEPLFPWDPCNCDKCNQVGWIFGLKDHPGGCLEDVCGLTSKQKYASHKIHKLYKYLKKQEHNRNEKKPLQQAKKDIVKYIRILGDLPNRKISF